MYPVTQDFLDKMKADRRQVLARVAIDYTDPFIDQSLEIEANEQANVSYPQQTADSVDQTTHKYACLDGTWDLLSGEYHLAPSPNMLSQYQMGWWSAQFGDSLFGEFTWPVPTLTITHLPRPIRSLRVVGDTARGEYPILFRINLYGSDGTLLYYEFVPNNTQVIWQKELNPQVLDVAKQELIIYRWSQPGTCAKIVEFFTSIREVYETSDIMSVRLLEEREASQGSLPVGNISSNEITLALSNADKKFDLDNENSPLRNLLKPNRRIQAWLGTDIEPELQFDGQDDYIELSQALNIFNSSFTIEIGVFHAAASRAILLGDFGLTGAINVNFELTADNKLRLYWAGSPDLYGVKTVPVGQWCNVAFVRDKSNSKVCSYVEGSLDIDYSGALSDKVATIPHRIGMDIRTGVTAFEGRIKYVRIWNKALTQEEIQVNFNKELTGNEEGLIAYYKLNEGEGTIAYDSAGNNNGTIYGARWLTGWVPLGTFWSLDWDSPDDSLEATVTARDRMELLRKSTFQTSQVLTNKSLYELAEAVLQDAGLTSDEYAIDTDLQNIIIPYAWFNPVSHREALRRIAEAGLATAFQNRDGKIQIESFLITGDEPVLEITEDDYFPPLRAPSRQDQVANEIIVDTQPLRPATTPEEVYRSNEPITIPASSTKTITAFYNKTPVIEATASLDNPPAGVSIIGVDYYGWGASVSIRNTNSTDQQVMLVIEGKPLTIQNKERAIARDEASITENGILRFEFPANPLVQTLSQAQAIADTLLASVKEPRRDIEVDWRGNPALLLGDRVTVKGKDYHVIRQEINWQGYLSARLTGRRAT